MKMNGERVGRRNWGLICKLPFLGQLDFGANETHINSFTLM